jgi:plastocyanin
MRLACALLILLFGLFIATTSAAAEVVHEIRVVDHRFIPASLTVNEGDTVRWVWEADFHNVVSGNIFSPDGAFQSATLNRGGSFEMVFDRNLLRSFPHSGNVYKYYCEPHAAMGMTGSITVSRVAKNYQSVLRNWQVVPPNSAASSGSCSLQLNANETQLTWSCSHSVATATSFSIRRGELGTNGSALCTVNGAVVNGAHCNLNAASADDLVAGLLYVQVQSTKFPGGELRGQIVAAGGSFDVSGEILRQSGSGGVADVLISDGTRTAMSDAQGNFALTGVPNGVYQLTATKSGYDVSPVTNVTPFLVNGADLAGRYFSASRTGGAGLHSPIKVLWNGFLRMTNILEIINKGNVDMPVTVSLFDIGGNLVHQQPVSIRANGQFDVIVNDLPGFQADSYGIVSLDFDPSFQNAIDGRMTNYRTAADGSYEFVFSVPFMAPLTRDSAVSFNTFNPTRNPAEANLPIAQWLSLVNLDPHASHSFLVSRYDQAGNLLRQDSYALPANGRTDIEGGHVLPGPNTVGLHIIQPDDPAAPYLAQLYRYSEGLGGKYNFAFPLLARGGSGEIQYAPLSTLNNGENWLELANVLDVPVSLTLQYFNQPGTLLRQDTVMLPPHAQQHFFAGALLAPGESGSVHVIPNTSGSLVGQSMYYFRNAAGTVTGMYGSGVRESAGTNFFGSYNLFLQMSNSLRISNTLNGPNPVTVTIFSDLGVPNTRVLNLAPQQTVDLRVEDPQYGTHPDSYGQIAVGSPESDSLLLEVVRMRLMPQTTDIDFALPTAVR